LTEVKSGPETGVVTDWEPVQLPPIRPTPLGTGDLLWLRSTEFAQAYNRWADQLNRGIIDYEIALEVQKKWKKLQECDGWPKDQPRRPWWRRALP
jgi:hypothetical protein